MPLCFRTLQVFDWKGAAADCFARAGLGFWFLRLVYVVSNLGTGPVMVIHVFSFMLRWPVTPQIIRHHEL